MHYNALQHTATHHNQFLASMVPSIATISKRSPPLPRQYVAVCCSVVQGVAVSGSVLHLSQRYQTGLPPSRVSLTATHRKPLHLTATYCTIRRYQRVSPLPVSLRWCSMLQYVAVRCRVLQCVAVSCSVLQCPYLYGCLSRHYGVCMCVCMKSGVGWLRSVGSIKS